jgi:NAD(P)H-hydrate epimerase
VPSNNALIQTAKGNFWNGIVIERSELSAYLEEAECILIGPGMTRSSETEELSNSLLKKYPHKKWVIDAGALQMIDPKLLNEKCVVTPHHGEFLKLIEHTHFEAPSLREQLNAESTSPSLQKILSDFSRYLNGTTILLKGVEDLVFQASTSKDLTQFEVITGGNAGMTKGGTGDVLAGLVAGLYTCSSPFAAAVVASVINKKAGDQLYQKVGPFFNSSDLVTEIPKVLWQDLNIANK